MNTRSETFDERWSRLRERTSRPGWLGPRSLAVPVATWQQAEELVRVVKAETGCSIDPFVSASETGSIGLRWGAPPGPVVDVELKANGEIEWESETADGFDCGDHDRGVVVQRIRETLCAA